MRFFCLFLLLWLYPAQAGAISYCEEENLVIDTETQWDFRNGFFHSIQLPTHRGEQILPTRSVLHLEVSPDSPSLLGIYEFPRRPNEVGLAYNLYRLQIQIGSDNEPDRQIVDQDYTSGCSGPGIALWPGGKLELRPIKVEPRADGSQRTLETVHLRFWGK